MKRIFLLPIVGVLSLGTLASYSTTARVTRHIPRNPGFMSGRTMNGRTFDRMHRSFSGRTFGPQAMPPATDVSLSGQIQSGSGNSGSVSR